MKFLTVDKDDKNALWSSSAAGFSLIEMLITISVMGIIAGTVFVQRSSFSESISLKNVAQEIAVAIRQAQVYGVSSRGSNLGDDFDEFSYGVYFNLSNEQSFLMYRDTRGNRGYQPADDLIETYQLPRDMRIRYICVHDDFDTTACNTADRDNLVIRFSRPHPDAQILTRNGNEITIGGQDAVTAVIAIEEIDSERQRRVVVRSSGYITVE